ncbi:hypothetical protein SHIRM173S_01643 [Streptomyces hirsutus]
MRSRSDVSTDDLRARIATGRIGADERLPEEALLASQYRVCSPTLRTDRAVLQAAALVENDDGQGNFVRRPLSQIHVPSEGVGHPATGAPLPTPQQR